MEVKQGEVIKQECLRIDEDRVFVEMEIETPVGWYIKPIIKTASHDFFQKYQTYSTVAKLQQVPSRILRRGQELHITLWHSGLIVKIDAKTKRGWKTVYEITELPEGLTCLAEHQR